MQKSVSRKKRDLIRVSYAAVTSIGSLKGLGLGHTTIVQTQVDFHSRVETDS